MGKFALGIDLGTTAVKAVVLGESGTIVATGSAPVRLITGPNGLVEQDVRELWGSAVHAVKQAVGGGAASGTARRDIEALALSSQGGTLLLLDKTGQPIGNAISWMDTRPASLLFSLSLRERVDSFSLSLRERVGVRDSGSSAAPVSASLTLPSPKGRGSRIPSPRGRGRMGDDAIFYEKTGWSLRLGCLPLAQLIRLGSEEPGLLHRVRHIRFVDSYVAERLTGEAVTDPSDAAIATLYNVRERRWDADVLQLAGVAPDMLPRVAPSGTAIGPIRRDAAEELGLSPNARVFAGGHDQYCAAFGAGCRAAGDTIVSCGTAWVLLTMTTEPRFDREAQLAPAEAVTAGLWGLLGSCSGVGAAADWFRRAAAPDGREIPFGTLESAAAAVPPSADGIVFVPPVAGGRGRLVGFGMEHGFGHLARAMLEGAALSARALLGRMRAGGCTPSLLKAVGGATRSRLWMQILSDATGLPLEVAGLQEVAAYGAARVAGQAAGIIPPDAPWPQPVARIEPRPQFRETYDALAARFRE